MDIKQEVKKRQELLVKLFHKAPIANTYGKTLSYKEDGTAVFHMPYNPGFDHGLNQIHGGVYASLLDNAGWFTLAPFYKTWIATVEFQTRLLAPAERVGLIGSGKIIKLGKSIATSEMEIHTDEGRLVGIGSGTYSVTSVPLG